jgi:hypothetical protein
MSEQPRKPAEPLEKGWFTIRCNGPADLSLEEMQDKLSCIAKTAQVRVLRVLGAKRKKEAKLLTWTRDGMEQPIYVIIRAESDTVAESICTLLSPHLEQKRLQMAE